jgi:hypothetical protein
MNRLVALGAALAGGVIGFQLSQWPRRRFANAFRHRMLRRMENLIDSLPDNSPPKLIMSVLPRLRDQNDQIIATLQEQNALLREHLERPH